MDPYIIFAGSSHPELARSLSKEMGIPLGKVKKVVFPDGETGIEIEENVLCKDVFILQSCVGTPDHYFMELLLMVDALKRAGAKEIVAILPYYPYGRQDRLTKPGEPISARVIAECLEAVGVTRVIGFDLHQGQLEGFFNVPFLQLFSLPILADKIKSLKLKNLIVVAPDAGSVKIARRYAESLKCDFAIVDKFRGPSKMEMRLIGDVYGKTVLLVDDMCSTGTTLTHAADLCMKSGAERVLAMVTHGIFANGAEKLIDQSLIEKLLVSDTVPTKTKSKKIERVSITPLLAKGIRSVI